jgi:hypothetical protein
MAARLFTAALGLAATATARIIPRQASCPIVFDGRVPSTAAPTDFDTANGGGWNPFNPGYVKGATLEWSDIILLPEGLEASLFDSANSSASPEVTISDLSIFNNQQGFRRAGLQFREDTNAGSPGSSGKKTLHFSLRLDEERLFNLTHEYLVRNKHGMVIDIQKVPLC